MSGIENQDEQVVALWKNAREKAALRGVFEPLEVMGADPASPPMEEFVFVEALTRLGSECEEVRDDTRPKWRMNADSRMSILRQLHEEQRLTDMANLVRREDNDVFGRYLVESVLGHNVLTRKSSREELDELHTAVQFAADFNIACAKPIEVELELARKEADEAIGFLLPHRLIGRENALRKLGAFTQTPPVDAEPTIALVTGPGGAGKSALLAEFVRKWRRRDATAAIVWIDFDRAGMVDADPITLMLEFAFQLSLAYADLAPQLADFREQVRGLVVGPNSNFEIRASYQSAMWSAWEACLGTSLPLSKPVVLILDTFEEVLCRERLVSSSLLRWIDNLVAEGKVSGLKPIVSGRAVPEEAISPMLDRIDLRLPLGDITPASARKLLAMHLERHGEHADAFPLDALVKRLGGNPLLLKILAQDLHDHGQTEAQQILDEVGESKFQSRFGQMFLYRRILGRMREDDHDVVKVAHPGLILRRVTPALIRDVLAEPCGLGPINDDRAKELFDKLAQQVWLVERIGDDAVRHRRDLRRLMLQAMASEQPEVTGNIHARAMAFYRNYRDASIGRREQDTERRYHSMFTANPDMPQDREAEAFITAIGEDILDIDLSLRAELKVRGSRALFGDETMAVPEPLQSRAESQARSSRREQGSLEEIVEFSEERTLSLPGEIERTFVGLFNASRFPDIAGNAELSADRFFEDHMAGVRWSTDSKGTMLDHPMWCIAMAVLPTAGRRRFAKRFADNALAKISRIEWRKPLIQRSDSVSMAVMTACVLALHGESVPPFLVDAVRESGMARRREDHEMLRQLGLMCGQSGHLLERSRVFVPLQLLRFMSPEFRSAVTSIRPDEATISEQLLSDPSMLLHRDIEESQRTSLGSIESMGGSGKSREGIVVPQWPPRNPAVARLLRSTLVELYAPARGCLQRAGHEVVLEYAERMERSDPWWPLELHAELLQGGLRRDANRWLATFIRMCDRFGRFEDLLAFISQRAPKNTRANELLVLLRAYERRLDTALFPQTEPEGIDHAVPIRT